MILVIAVLVLLVGALAAIIALNSSRRNIRSSHAERSKLEAVYDADKALKMAISKIRNSANFYTSAVQPRKLYGQFDQATEAVTNLPNCESLYTWTSADATNPALLYSTATTGKQICNFMASEIPDTAKAQVRVSIRRDKDATIATSGNSVGVYLVSVIVKRADGSVDKLQSAVLQPLTNIAQQMAQDPNLYAYPAATIRPK